MDNLRIVYTSSVTVNMLGEAQRYLNDTDGLPLFVLNDDEISAEGIERVLQEGTHKKIFCNSHRVELLREYSNSPKEFEIRFKELYAGYAPKEMKQLFKLYENAETPDEQQAVLEDFYDDLIDNLDINRIVRKAERANTETDELRSASHYFSFDEWLSKLPFIGPLIKLILTPFANHFAKISEKAEDRLEKNLEKAEQVREIFREYGQTFPQYMQDVLEGYGLVVYIADTESQIIENTSIFSRNHAIGNAVFSKARVSVTISDDTLQQTIYEELVHYLDGITSFSSREDWEGAVAMDFTNDNIVLKEYYARYDKGWLLNPKYYHPDSIPIEALADIHNIIGIEESSEEFHEAAREAFPNTYPLYMKFRRELIDIAQDIRKERDSTETHHVTTIHRDFVSGQSGRGTISLAGEGQIETPGKRNSWTDD